MCAEVDNTYEGSNVGLNWPLLAVVGLCWLSWANIGLG